MSARTYGILGRTLRDIDRVFTEPADWDELIRRAREADLLGTLAYRLAERGRLGDVPAAPRAHLVSARTLCDAQQAAVHREVAEIGRALAPLQTPVVLLKGAAYLLAELPAANGRLFSDVDILVQKDALPAVESALMLAGYATTHHDPYDQRYYRQWMHELPPMQHVKRMTLLDVHHALVPETARVRPDSRALFRRAIALERDGVSMLAPSDMVLHSATHLFNNEELTHGLRDLVDIDALLRHFGADGGFWDRLIDRAGELQLTRPLYYAAQWTTRLLDTPVPPDAQARIRANAPAAPTRLLMNAMLGPALRPTVSMPGTRWARRVLYVRGHWLKMPVGLLAVHLTIKAFRREQRPTA